MSRVDEICNEINSLNKELIVIQNQCSHPKKDVKSKKGSSTGNYDPSSDSYWIDYHCTLCNKKWSKDQ